MEGGPLELFVLFSLKIILSLIGANRENIHVLFNFRTSIDQYLNFHSNHLQHKRAVVNTLLLRAHTLVSEDVDKVKEIQHVKEAKKANNYPDWMLTIPNADNTGSASRDSEESVNEKRIYASVPYIQGTSERLQRAFKSHEVTLVHEPFNSLRSQLVHVKDKTENLKKCGTIYHIHCEQCDKDYVGETSRLLEHLSRNSSAVHEHCQLKGHSVDSSKTKVLATESNTFKRCIKPATHLAIDADTLGDFFADRGDEAVLKSHVVKSPNLMGWLYWRFAAMTVENRGNGHTWRMPANLIADI